jgi:hypothetical protein
MTQETSPDEPIRAHMTCGPFTGLRVTGDDGRQVLYHDPTAKGALIERAIDCLRGEAILIETDGRRYIMEGGVAPALHILQAVRERG